MRLGEIKNIVGFILNENKNIKIEHEIIYGGQAYKVNNFLEIFEALDILSKQGWNTTDYSNVEIIKNKYITQGNPVILDASEFNQLSSYINDLNPKMPLYYSVLEYFSEKQDEKIINIQLPSKEFSFTELSEINKRLEDVLKCFNVDGPFKFRGFDKGTDWYIVLATGVLSHQYLIACLQITQEYLKTRTEYFKSEQAKLAYEASLSDNNSKESYDKYQEKYLNLLVKREVKKAIENIKETNGKSVEELNSHLVIATKKLVKELGDGVEFHLSLNPPEYAKERVGNLSIDYKKINMQEREGIKDEKTKQIEASKKGQSN